MAKQKMSLIRRKLLVASFYSIWIILIGSAHVWPVLKAAVLSPLSLLACFITLGIITSDYLTPNLAVISQEILFISDRVSGMTLMALGNALPDITSTYKAMKRDATTLAIGESFGAIFFLLTVVIGSMLMVRNIQLSKRSEYTQGNFELDPDNIDAWDTIYYNRNQFLRDLFMFAFLIIMNISFLRDGQIAFWECLVMCISYCLYAAYLIVSIQRPDVSNRDENVPNITVTGPQIHEEDNMERFLKTVQDRRNYLRKKIRMYLRRRYKGWANLKLNDTLDLWENSTIFEHEVDQALSRATSPIARPLARSNSETNFQHLQSIPQLSLNGHAAAMCTNGGTSIKDPNESKSDNSFSIVAPKPINTSRQMDLESQSIDSDDNFLQPGRMEAFRSISVDNLRMLSEQSSMLDEISELDFELNHGISAEPEDRWDSKLRIVKYLTDGGFTTSTFELLVILVTTPIIFLLTFIIPLHYPSQSGNQFFRIAYYTQCAFSPFISYLLVQREFNLWLFGLGMLAGAILVSFYMAGKLHIKAKYISIFGFILSLSSISFIVGTVIDILTNWVEIFDVSEAILGLTVFAWGNSIGDLVSNIAFTKIGVLEIALGSCFGSPLLYFLFGVGIDGLLVILQRNDSSEIKIWNRYIEFEVNDRLIVSCIGIVLAFGIFIFIVPLNRWKLDKKIGGLLLLLYVSVTGINIKLELTM
ncbi:putative cation exchanger YDL206W [Kluyveromyces marxianus]|uniref:Cation exchanger YDL206W n=1 Tax=Kluyveromyces marxianus TaxID=4911 RepID=A0ABX6EUL4_KLUMA|nr:putative cation exchanger YDL206W [Kluyveromyces marxianus]BAP71300.1 putative cation exchanger YDL206W [Kluyveromyces marxianus]